MLHFELECGGCGAILNIDTDDETYTDTAWLLVQRFCNAHAASCDFMTGLHPDQSAPNESVQTQVIKPGRTDEEPPS